jgi:hypothetical protein
MELWKIFQGISKKMYADFELVTSQIPHMGDMGTNREDVIKSFLKKHLPGKFDIGSGQAISADGQISKQLDSVIYSKASCPLWYNESTQIFPSESVCAVTEIKSRLDKTVLETCVENIRSVRKLPKLGGKRPLAPNILVSGDNPSTFGSVFAYSSNTSLESLRDNLNIINKTIPPNERISVLCVLDKGILINVNPALNQILLLPNHASTIASVKAEENSLLLFFLLLNSYLNAIEVIPPDLLRYTDNFISQFNWETKQV